MAVRFYVLKMMLNRGYTHPIQNLLVNNPFANPALYLDPQSRQVPANRQNYASFH